VKFHIETQTQKRGHPIKVNFEPPLRAARIWVSAVDVVALRPGTRIATLIGRDIEQARMLR